MNEIWVFNGEGANFPAGIFTSLTEAKTWIEKHQLSGVLTRYPVNTGVYDWAIANDLFTAKQTWHTKPVFIESFTCASMEHYHFEAGQQQ